MAEKFKNIEIKNKKASFEYFLLQKYEAGIILKGTEIKAIRLGAANLTDAFCYIRSGEVFVKNLFISEYSQGSYYNHEARRERKLLLNKGELKKIERKLSEKGFTLVPLRLYVTERGFAKLEISLAQGKKMYDKRASIKEKDTQRDLDRYKVTR
ncbi:MAG: SsrA-binding protein SmpB [Saprospiraceae bacterium]|jgi:SsrA-binding protein|nr:SsrA-binding protein SmpB [Saprospiraceae bacterium]MCA0332694.1 SsrA-binding protein SmpB [Bacteroidota bacterium]MCB0603928.1 SsrA-binding protein SmpB [Saprospiraceae bacterium]MCO5278085.1 SsrA-binding protein SmpB [Saprospiraceae bacterium]HMT77079.1 SsrA-binding protein SmpB [Saprospiraceae bacterium]